MKHDPKMESPLDVRPSPIAGRWYPADPAVLAASVDDYMDAAGSALIDSEILGVIVPHAGHLYSGPVAGYAFAALRGLSPARVAVISPMHYPAAAPLLTTDHAAYATPLGNVPVDRAGLEVLDRALEDRLGFGLRAVRNDAEHSLEIELPFLQRALAGAFKLLPIMLRDQSAQVARALGDALAHMLQAGSALLVASSDLSHFYTQEEARQLDGEVLRAMEAFDPGRLLQLEAAGKGFACGKGAVAAVLWAAQQLGADQVRVLRYATSGDVTGDRFEVVGYGAAVITKTRK